MTPVVTRRSSNMDMRSDRVGQIMDESTERPLTSALLELLEACVALKTTEGKALARHLGRAEGTIRIEFCRIYAALNVGCRYSAIRAAEERGLI